MSGNGGQDKEKMTCTKGRRLELNLYLVRMLYQVSYEVAHMDGLRILSQSVYIELI